MKKFTDIGQFRNVVRAVKSRHDYKGRDENDDPIYGHTTPYPTLKFRGTPKLHGCLNKDTLVTLANGEQVKISEIKEGCYVLSFDTKTNKVTTNQVINVMNGVSDKEWCKLVFDDREIIVTKDHKFWTKNRGYVEAYKLLTSDEFEFIN